jgi:hypothetical protein
MASTGRVSPACIHLFYFVALIVIFPVIGSSEVFQLKRPEFKGLAVKQNP